MRKVMILAAAALAFTSLAPALEPRRQISKLSTRTVDLNTVPQRNAEADLCSAAGTWKEDADKLMVCTAAGKRSCEEALLPPLARRAARARGHRALQGQPGHPGHRRDRRHPEGRASRPRHRNEMTHVRHVADAALCAVHLVASSVTGALREYVNVVIAWNGWTEP